MSTNDDRLGIGGNRPPLITPDQLYVDNEDLMNAVSAIEIEATHSPTDVPDDATSGKLQDLIKTIDGIGKRAEMTRVGVKEPYLAASRAVDGYFKGIEERLKKARFPVYTRVANYLRAKEAKARLEREAEARRLREAEEEKRREAREAEERAARLREQKRPGAAVEKETLANYSRNEADTIGAAAIVAEQQAQVKPAELARTRSDEGGALGTLKEVWQFTIEDFDAIPGSPLWPYIPRAAKEQAIRAYMRQNAPPTQPKDAAPWNPLKGVKFFRTTDAVIR